MRPRGETYRSTCVSPRWYIWIHVKAAVQSLDDPTTSAVSPQRGAAIDEDMLTFTTLRRRLPPNL
jgi:hypothetical protein